MRLLLTFMAMVFTTVAAVCVLCILVEKWTSSFTSLLLFFPLFFLMIVGSWLLAVEESPSPSQDTRPSFRRAKRKSPSSRKLSATTLEHRRCRAPQDTSPAMPSLCGLGNDRSAEGILAPMRRGLAGACGQAGFASRFDWHEADGLIFAAAWRSLRCETPVSDAWHIGRIVSRFKRDHQPLDVDVARRL